jgi:hypothetical protein
MLAILAAGGIALMIAQQMLMDLQQRGAGATFPAAMSGK